MGVVKAVGGLLGAAVTISLFSTIVGAIDKLITTDLQEGGIDID
jgi:hypothetical protein